MKSFDAQASTVKMHTTHTAMTIFFKKSFSLSKVKCPSLIGQIYWPDDYRMQAARNVGLENAISGSSAVYEEVVRIRIWL